MINNENGRSMVEMLGVLAIIGVLSVAGIAGYTMAMKKYRVNEVVNTASQVAILARSLNAGNGGVGYATGSTGTTSGAVDTGIAKPNGVTKIEANCSSDPCTVTITGAGDLKDLIETTVGTSNGFYTATVSS